jgi:GNAT superfamily N-acetyltransferase
VAEKRTTDAAEGAALRAAGASLLRHSHDLVLDLASVSPGPDWSDPPLADGLKLIAVTEARAGLGSAMLQAYPPGHPDASHSPQESERRAQEVLSGGAGQVLEPPSAAIVEAARGSVAGAVVLTRLGPEPWGWDGGPWVAEVFVVPAYQGRGLGRALLRRAVAWSHAVGERWMGLTVTEGNPAERLYASVGFSRRRTLFVLETA